MAYLDSKKIRVSGMVSEYVRSVACGTDTSLRLQVTDVFKLEDYQLALDKMNSRGALKIAIKP